MISISKGIAVSPAIDPESRRVVPQMDASGILLPDNWNY